MVNKLRDIRMKTGMSVSELARRSGTTRQTITNSELHGQKPGIKLALQIAQTLNKVAKDIFLLVILLCMVYVGALFKITF